MDATRLPAPAAAVPSAPAAPSITAPDHPAPIAGRFAMQGSGAPTPTGLAGEATDLQGGGVVTLKLVSPEVLPTPTMADRALRELKQLAKVTSDRIVRPVDQGKLPDGRVYVATERVDGAMTLEELVAQNGALPLERARAIVLQVGEALTEAQKVGVIHRDVAPRNVLVGPGDHVKLADFGLAEPVPGPSGEAGGGTVAKVFGSPAFLSPEQAEGKPVDQRSNIYSLGAMYYYALTGQPPFSGDAAALLQQHLSVVPAPPSTKRPGLPAEVDRVILKALEKSGGRRHLTLRQLLTEVGAQTAPAAQPMRADAQAKTMMAEAPQIVPTTPQRPQVAQTMMGIPAPVGRPPAPQPAPTPAPPVVTTPSMPVAPAVTAPSMPAVPPQAPTMMAEAPRMPAPEPAAPQPPPSMPQAAPQAPTMMAEAPRLPTPQPPPSMPQAAPQAPTMMAEAPRAAVAAPAVPAGKPNNATGKKGAFRETAWFKRGEIEEEMAKAQAAAAQAGDPLKTGTTGKHLPLDESQVALSAQDHARLSLKTGATQAMPVIKTPMGLPGERMSEEEMLSEIAPSRKYLFIVGALVLAVVLGLVIYFATRGSPQAEAPPANKPAPVAAAPPAAAPAPTPPASPTPAAPPTTTPAAPKTTAAAPAPTAIKPAAPAAAPSGYAAEVDKLERAPSVDKRELKRLEKAIGAELTRAHHKKEKATEAADKQLLLRLRKLAKKK